MSLDSPIVNEITSNPVNSRSDLVHLLYTLLQPLVGAQSPGGARIHLGYTGTHFDPVAAEMEGFSRALWGLAPLMAAEPDRPGFKEIRERWVKGLESGTDERQESEYWGKCEDRDQRFVEMAPIGFALAVAPNVFWDPLSPKAKERLNDWLLQINELELPENNWRCECHGVLCGIVFLILTNIGLRSVGARYDQKRLDETLEFIECWYGDHGFPSDGPNDKTKAYDYYATSFAIPFYSLIYARLCSTSDPVRAERYRKRALANMPCAVQLFAPDGGGIAFGRSMTYRFAMSCFWAAVAFDRLELPAPFTWGVVKGLLLRNIRSFIRRPECFNRDGSLTIGVTNPCQFMSEDYNSPQSPYWALKSFLVLALPEHHPFWQAKKEPYPSTFIDRPFTVVRPWMQVFSHAGGHTFCLSSGQMASGFRHSAAKYCKFAYSSAFGFSVPVGASGISQHAPDSMLALCDDPEGEHWVVRRSVRDVEFLDGGVIKSKWDPYDGVAVTTWLIPPLTSHIGYHTRVHKVINATETKISYSEGGFVIHGTTGPPRSERKLPFVAQLAPGKHGIKQDTRSVVIVSKAGVSGTVSLLRGDHSGGEDVGPDESARGRAQWIDSNSNIITPRPILPSVVGSFGKGTMWIAVRVFAVPSTEDGKVGQMGDGWIEEWERCVEGVGGWDGLKKEYPFLS